MLQFRLMYQVLVKSSLRSSQLRHVSRSKGQVEVSSYTFIKAFLLGSLLGIYKVKTWLEHSSPCQSQVLTFCALNHYAFSLVLQYLITERHQCKGVVKAFRIWHVRETLYQLRTTVLQNSRWPVKLVQVAEEIRDLPATMTRRQRFPASEASLKWNRWMKYSEKKQQ